jgi:hypothetical protein
MFGGMRTSPLLSNLQLTAPWLRGEPTGPAALPSWVLSTPLRLSLQGDIHAIAGGFANSVSREEASGNTINGSAVQRFAAIRLTKQVDDQQTVTVGVGRRGIAVGGAW